MKRERKEGKNAVGQRRVDFVGAHARSLVNFRLKVRFLTKPIGLGGF